MQGADIIHPFKKWQNAEEHLIRHFVPPPLKVKAVPEMPKTRAQNEHGSSATVYGEIG